MLTRLRNANLAKHQIVEVPATRMTRNIANILLEEGFIQNFEEVGETFNTQLLVSLKYKGKTRQPIITALKRVSKPGLRVYRNAKKLPRVLANLGIAIVSTPQGLMTNLKAKKLGIGGEILCYIW
jgi:small subunit ribosomal protein S8